MRTSVEASTRATAVRVALPGRWSPGEVLRALRDDDRPFALVGGGWAGGGPVPVLAVLGSEPVRVAGPDDDPFALLGTVPGVDEGPASDRAVAVGGGWFGYLGYQLNRTVERIPPAPGRPPALPAAALAYYDHVVCQGPDGRWWFEALATPERRDALDGRHDLLARRLAGAPPPARPHACAPFRLVPGPGRHRAAIRSAIDYVRSGDIFQANVCLRAESRLDGDPLDLFAAGAEALRPAFGAYLRLPEGAVCSFSPELFLEVRGRQARTSPIKGTAPRAGYTGGAGDTGTAEGERLALEASAKDRAENVMIVDLMRNDLSRVCRPGSVAVPDLARAEAHPGLWHLVSDVVGELRPGADAADLVRAAFPPGSCTGAPKVRAMEVINELEATARGVYTGAVGFAGPVAGLTLNVAIRTVEWAAATGELTLGVGGGIVADSDPDAELGECLVKASPIVAALGGRLAGAAPAPAPAPTPVGSPRAPRRPGAPAPLRLPLPRVTVGPLRPRPGRVVVVDNYDSFTYNLVHYLALAGAEPVVVRNDAALADVAALGPAALVLSPGPCSPAEAGVSAAVVDRLGPEVPLLGVCLGHQCIGAVYGGRVVRAGTPVHGKRSPVHHDGRGVLAGLPSPLAATRYHSLVVDALSVPADLVVSARTDDGLVMGLRHATHPVEGVQFHPESILTEHGQAMITSFVTAATTWHTERHAATHGDIKKGGNILS